MKLLEVAIVQATQECAAALIAQSRRTRTIALATRDAARLTSAMSRALRQHWAGWCATCLAAVTPDDAGLMLEFQLAGDGATLERALVHVRCAAAWIRARVQPDYQEEPF